MGFLRPISQEVLKISIREMGLNNTLINEYKYDSQCSVNFHEQDGRDATSAMAMGHEFE